MLFLCVRKECPKLEDINLREKFSKWQPEEKWTPVPIEVLHKVYNQKQRVGQKEEREMDIFTFLNGQYMDSGDAHRLQKAWSLFICWFLLADLVYISHLKILAQ